MTDRPTIHICGPYGRITFPSTLISGLDPQTQVDFIERLSRAVTTDPVAVAREINVYPSVKLAPVDMPHLPPRRGA